ncbi:DUF202 domain-containing protein [Nocardia sp. NPDC056100]|uniref:DUF202 domain-containing protein n=1 Tax=Nocardia sp. NPDC056100 TaxID=3345712 RepID=UPI0035DD2896
MTAPTFAEERTALSWRRTAVAAMGTAALFVHQTVATSWHGASAAPLGAAVTLMALTLIAIQRSRALTGGSDSDGARHVALATAAVTGVGLVALVIALTYPSIR